MLRICCAIVSSAANAAWCDCGKNASPPLVAASSDGTERFALIRHQMFARASASLILFHRLRLALDVPVVVSQVD